MKEKTCRECKNKFTPLKPLQYVCSPACAYKRVTKQRQKAEKQRERREHKEAKERIKTKSDWLREAQSAFNKYIRERDKEQPCISCGRFHDGQYHAGHYRTVGAHPELRFCEDNCHKQCAPCNNHKSGNIVEYRINLSERIGEDRLKWLEGPHAMPNWTIDDIKAIKEQYKQMLKELVNDKFN